MEYLFELLKGIHDVLIKNESIGQVFNLEDDKMEDEKFAGLIIDKAFNWEDLLNNCKFTVKYLIEFALKNDDVDSDEMDLSANIYDLHNLFESKLYSVSLFDLPLKVMLFKTHVLMLMFSVTATVTKDVDKLIGPDLHLLHKEEDNTYYRGHSDEKFSLMPSIYRSFSYSGKQFVFNIDTLYELYNRLGLIKKYKKAFGFRSVDQEFCSFMQHSTSFSPLLDLTKNHLVALSFATVCTDNYNDYLNKNAAIYKFVFKEDIKRNDLNIKELNIYFLKNKFKFHSTFKGVSLAMLVPSSFNPSVFITEKATNDRMKYQKGSFLFFQSCVIVNNHILMPYAIGKIVKYRISSPNIVNTIFDKSKIYNEIRKTQPAFDMEHLMDPYLFFSETPKIK